MTERDWRIFRWVLFIHTHTHCTRLRVGEGMTERVWARLQVSKVRLELPVIARCCESETKGFAHLQVTPAPRQLLARTHTLVHLRSCSFGWRLASWLSPP